MENRVIIINLKKEGNVHYVVNLGAITTREKEKARLLPLDKERNKKE